MALEPASVVIPSWNGAALLRPTLMNLVKLEGLEFEVLVVDHGRINRDSEAVVREVSAHHPNVFYLGREEQLGYAGAVNFGASQARYRLVAVLCNDVLVEKDWLAELVRVFADRAGRHPVVTSLVHRPGFDNPLGARMNIWGRIVKTGEAPGKEYIPFFPDGSAFLFDKNFLGLPFDSDYFLYQEDVSIGWRSWLMGEEVVLAPLSLALNADGGTTRRTPFSTAYFTERNRWLNYFIFLSFWSLLRLLPLLWLDAALKLIAGSNRRAKLYAWCWLFAHPIRIWGKRRAMQRQRTRSDAEILARISFVYADRGVARCVNGLVKGYVRAVGLNGANLSYK